MVLKCCVPRCYGNYASSKDKVSIYKFSKEEDKRRAWASAIPRSNLIVTAYTAVCRRHWPDDAEFVKVKSKSRPKHPSVFPGIPKSCLATPQSEPRKTSGSLSHARNQSVEGLNEFVKNDSIVFSTILDKIKTDFDNLIAFAESENCIVLQSFHFEHGMPQFVIKLFSDFNFSCYFFGSPCQIESLVSNSIHVCKTWSTLTEIIRFLSSKQKFHKIQILLEQSSVTMTYYNTAI